ncbi:unnamed protein product [Amoebophrya sp. A120]|nr:unnamed protein product [Amoebophrya sp. A120]|eukprot:GSA120T00020162001.1
MPAVLAIDRCWSDPRRGRDLGEFGCLGGHRYWQPNAIVRCLACYCNGACCTGVCLTANFDGMDSPACKTEFCLHLLHNWTWLYWCCCISYPNVAVLATGWLIMIFLHILWEVLNCYHLCLWDARTYGDEGWGSQRGPKPIVLHSPVMVHQSYYESGYAYKGKGKGKGKGGYW